MAHVFISHQSSDQQVASRFCSVLERDGLTCWIAPRNIGPGASWPEAIVTAISDSWLMICVMSRHAYQSKQMAREMERADSGNVAILPVRIDSTPLDGELQYFLGNRQWLDLSHGVADDHDRELVQVVRELQRQRANPAPPVSGRSGRAATSSQLPPIAPPHPAGGIVDVIRDETAQVVHTFVSVLAKRERALDGLVLSDSRTLGFALRFLVYMALASLVLHLPAFASQGISLNNPAYALAFLTDDLIEKLALCVILHMICRSVGGAADLRESITAFGFLCAFAPLIAVSLIPSQELTGSLLSRSKNAPELLGQLSQINAGSTAWDQAMLVIAFGISSAVWLIFFVSLFKAYRSLHRLGRARATLAFVAGVAAWIIAQIVVLQPFQANMFRAFADG